MEEIEKINPLSLETWKDFCETSSVVDIMESWRELDDDMKTQHFLYTDRDTQTDLLLLMTTSEQEDLILSLAKKDIKELINDIPPDDLVDLFQQVSPNVREAVWSNLSEETKEIANFLLRFDYDDAAGIMTPHYVKVKPDITVEQTIKFIRKNIDKVETIYYIYIVDAINRLQGVVSLRDMFRKKDGVKLSDFMETKIFSVQEDTDQRDVAEILTTHDLLAVPVVDQFNRLLGIVTIDDAIQVISDEHDENFLKLSAITGSSKNHPKSYLEQSIFYLFKSRAPWLIILLIAGTLTTNVINMFTDLIQIAAYLVLFIPVITSTGGNTATQSAALMIQGLARNDLSFKNIFKIVLKEGIIAFFIGLSLFSVMLLRSIFLPPSIPFAEAIIISSALIFVVIFSALIGVLAPLVISRIGADPTVIATPLIATLIDLVGLSIYFLMAQFFLV